MKRTISVAIYSCVFLGACSGGYPSKPAGITTKPEGPKISFGIYDIAKSPSFSDLFAAPEPLYQKGIEARSTSNSEPPANGKNQEVEKATIRQTNIADAKPELARKVVKTAEIHLEAAEPDTAQKKVATIAESNGGFVVESEQSMSDITTNVRDSVSITIRVPSDRFAGTIDEVRGSVDRILVEAEKGEDVTEEFVDITARLRAKKALEAQFMEIMKQADTVEDALSVQTQLANVRTDIEKIEGRMRFLENQSALSTIKVHVQTPALFAANSAGFFYRLRDSTGRGLEAALNFTLGLVTFVIGAFPFALFIGLPVFLVGRSFLRKREAPMSVTEIAKEEIRSE